MKKLTLNVEALEVTSFHTVTPGDARGTVGAHEMTDLVCQTVFTRHTCCTST